MGVGSFFFFFEFFFFSFFSFLPSSSPLSLSFFLHKRELLLTLTMNEKANIALTLSRVTAKTWTSPTRRCRNEAPPRRRTGAGVPPLPPPLVATPPPPRPTPPPNLDETAPPRPPVRIWLRKAAGRAGLVLFLSGVFWRGEGEGLDFRPLRVPVRFFVRPSMAPPSLSLSLPLSLSLSSR